MVQFVYLSWQKDSRCTTTCAERSVTAGQLTETIGARPATEAPRDRSTAAQGRLAGAVMRQKLLNARLRIGVCGDAAGCLPGAATAETSPPGRDVSIHSYVRRRLCMVAKTGWAVHATIVIAE